MNQVTRGEFAFIEGELPAVSRIHPHRPGEAVCGRVDLQRMPNHRWIHRALQQRGQRLGPWPRVVVENPDRIRAGGIGGLHGLGHAAGVASVHGHANNG